MSGNIAVQLARSIEDHQAPPNSDEISFLAKKLVNIIDTEEKRDGYLFGEIVVETSGQDGSNNGSSTENNRRSVRVRGWFPAHKVKMTNLGEMIRSDSKEKQEEKDKELLSRTSSSSSMNSNASVTSTSEDWTPRSSADRKKSNSIVKIQRTWRFKQKLRGLMGQKDDEPVAPKVFRVPLTEIMKVEENGVFQEWRLPAVVLKCLEFFRQGKVMKEQGLFRVPGNTIVIAALKQSFDRGEEVSFVQCGISDIASLFKQYFAELPEPLLTFELYDQFQDAISLGTPAEKSQELNSLIEKLPEPHKMVYRVLIEFLADLALFSDENKMTASNIGIVFGPNILRKKDPDITSMIFEMKTAGDLMSFLIRDFNEKRGKSEPVPKKEGSEAAEEAEKQRKLLEEEVKRKEEEQRKLEEEQKRLEEEEKKRLEEEAKRKQKEEEEERKRKEEEQKRLEEEERKKKQEEERKAREKAEEEEEKERKRIEEEKKKKIEEEERKKQEEAKKKEEEKVSENSEKIAETVSPKVARPTKATSNDTTKKSLRPGKEKKSQDGEENSSGNSSRLGTLRSLKSQFPKKEKTEEEKKAKLLKKQLKEDDRKSKEEAKAKKKKEKEELKKKEKEEEGPEEKKKKKKGEDVPKIMSISSPITGRLKLNKDEKNVGVTNDTTGTAVNSNDTTQNNENDRSAEEERKKREEETQQKRKAEEERRRIEEENSRKKKEEEDAKKKKEAQEAAERLKREQEENARAEEELRRQQQEARRQAEELKKQQTTVQNPPFRHNETSDSDNQPLIKKQNGTSEAMPSRRQSVSQHPTNENAPLLSKGAGTQEESKSCCTII